MYRETSGENPAKADVVVVGDWFFACLIREKGQEHLGSGFLEILLDGIEKICKADVVERMNSQPWLFLDFLGFNSLSFPQR